jgi:hypothetical protein
VAAAGGVGGASPHGRAAGGVDPGSPPGGGADARPGVAAARDGRRGCGACLRGVGGCRGGQRLPRAADDEDRRRGGGGGEQSCRAAQRPQQAHSTDNTPCFSLSLPAGAGTCPRRPLAAATSRSIGRRRAGAPTCCGGVGERSLPRLLGILILPVSRSGRRRLSHGWSHWVWPSGYAPCTGTVRRRASAAARARLPLPEGAGAGAATTTTVLVVEPAPPICC